MFHPPSERRRSVSPNCTVGIVAEHDLMDSALVALVSSFGYRAVLINGDRSVEEPAPEALSVVVVRSRRRLLQAFIDGRCAGVPVLIADVAGTNPVRSADPRVTVIGADDRAGRRLDETLSALLGPPGRPVPGGAATHPGAVAVSRREREVLTTYALGATVDETAAAHFVATSTVRTHYRRVTARYTGAGRPVTNKAQLLLQLVADGWIRLPAELGAVPHGAESAEGSDSVREGPGAA